MAQKSNPSEGQISSVLRAIGTTPHGIILASIDRELRYTWIFNPHPDFVPDAVLGKTDIEVADNSGTRQLYDLKQRAIDLSTSVHEDITFPVSNGPRTYSVTVIPMYDSEELLIGAVTASVDITDQKLIESESRLKSEFLAHMSHELRTPLNSIIGFSEALLVGELGKIENEKHVGYIRDIHASGKHLLSVINDVLDLTKIEAGRFELIETDVNLLELLADCVHLVEGNANDQFILVQIEHQDLVPRLRADERLLKQIVVNLLSNSLKYTSKEGDIIISAWVDENDIISISVSDTGRGISKDNIAKVLEPFGQSRDDAEHTHTGTGLGLPLSKRFVELHEGTLKIESVLGEGTIVTVSFPAERTISG